ncbi:5-oxoprolinase subunit PxpA [Vreelandella rituensis]|uniref:LamB/YcsF family protein n=1 Tax=Vreelandella rituensis TaxID=2282306 RepID=A0A368TS32_9GAMM|nr:5-oxoprolinase subunit PxpA [Halomonas rituensis]RCV87411.1 LamB/YcsF family protein [Halomonas rituensis]
MKLTIDLNADMGEGLGAWTIGDGVDASMLPLISTANVAAGFHAGDSTTMVNTLRDAARHGVAIGVHPGFNDLIGFGRRHIDASPEELVNDVLYQLGALRELANREGLSLHHLKLHGALFMHAARDEDFAQALCATLQQSASELPIYCLAGTALDLAAAERGLPRVHEFYADRAYDDQGGIVFVRRVARLDPDQVASKVLRACHEGVVASTSGRLVPVSFQSICIHSDTPGALELTKAVRGALDEAGITVKAFSS